MPSFLMTLFFGRGELMSSSSPGDSTGGINGSDNTNDSIALIDALGGKGGGSSCDAIILDVSLVRPGRVNVVVISWEFDWWH